MVSVYTLRRTTADQSTASRKRSLSTVGVSTLPKPSTRRLSREYSGPETRSHAKGETAYDGKENDPRAKGDGKATAHTQATPGTSVSQRRTRRQRLGNLLTPEKKLRENHFRTPEVGFGFASSSTGACTVWPCEEEIASHSVTWQKLASPRVTLTPADERRERMLQRRVKRENGFGMGSRDHPTKEHSREGATRARRRSSVPKGKQSSRKKRSEPMTEGCPASKRRRGVPDAGAKCPRAKSHCPPTSSSVSSKVQVEPATNDKKGHEQPSAPVMNWWRNQRLVHRPTCRMKLAEARASAADSESSSWKFVAPPKTVSGQLAQAALHGDRNDSRSKVEGRSDDEDITWTESQLRSLRSAQVDTDPSAKNFWDLVASRVEGRSRGECQRKWFREFVSPSLPRKRRPPRKPAGKKRVSSSRPASLSSSSQGIQGKEGGAAVAGATPGSDRADDLFQATPMRGFAPLSMKAEQQILVSENAAAAQSAPFTVEGFDTHAAEGHANGEGAPGTKRPRANKTYVQAVSKRLHKVAGMANGRYKHGDASVGRGGGCHGVSSSSSSSSARQFHKISTSSDRGSMKASLSASGTLCVTFKGAASDDWSDGNDLGLGDASDQVSSGSDSEA